ncbi:MAG: DNA starvation/stationary phase protection protein [Ignavibacteria bacterium]|nr:DNA starvation/stationary phase protection protein [Ignavibacteria bacterium]
MNTKLINLLNKNLADLQILYVKLHNYHWNVKGSMFKPVHEQTEAYYDYIAEQFDKVAERIIQIGGKPSATLQEYLKKSTLKEESENSFDGKYVLSSVLSDFEFLNIQYKEISSLAGEGNDIPTSNIADDNIAWLEKEIWMIRACIG